MALKCIRQYLQDKCVVGFGLFLGFVDNQKNLKYHQNHSVKCNILLQYFLMMKLLMLIVPVFSLRIHTVSSYPSIFNITRIEFIEIFPVVSCLQYPVQHLYRLNKHTQSLCEANRHRQQTRLKKPVSSVPFYFDFYRKGCVSVCLEMPVAVPTQPPVNIHPWGLMNTQINTHMLTHTCTSSEI